MINGEKAAFNTPTFAQKRERTLDMLIKDLFSEHMNEGRGVSRYPIIKSWVGWWSDYFGFPLSLSFHQCSILIFILILFLSGRKVGKSWETSNKGMLDLISESTGKKIIQDTNSSQTQQFYYIITFTATCFNSIESSSGLLENRCNVSTFIVHSGIPKECTINVDTLDTGKKQSFCRANRRVKRKAGVQRNIKPVLTTTVVTAISWIRNCVQFIFVNKWRVLGFGRRP